MSTVSERMVTFLREQKASGVPAEVRHEAERLLLNQLKASVGAAAHPAVELLHDWKRGAATPGDTARVLWRGTQTSTEHAAMVNGALFEVLDFHDTYIPTYLHAVSGVLPAVLALGEALGSSGADVVDALALGIEVELAIATILMPTGYFRGFVPLGLVGGVGAAAACSVLGGLDDEQARNALGLAMCTAGGTYESVGSMGLAYVTASAARNGLDCYQLAARGFDAPATAFEGDKGMLASYSDEPAEKTEGVLATLGSTWRIFGQSYKTVPTETITHAPIECVLDVRARAGERTVASMRFGVEPIVVTIADERLERFGLPSSDLEARFDLRFCAAAAWLRGRFGIAEMQEPTYTDQEVLALRATVELVPDEERKSFDGCWLEVGFEDGSTERVVVDFFRGSADNPVTDDELGALFLAAADDHLDSTQAQAVVDAALALSTAPDLETLMTLCTAGSR
ncbi:MAG TPA: MmgE/PrpD family protein [Mycobacteriales bacterium]|jgi:2-methylcitrate dehydratase PrpD|nr:MmgE/PrpD family protein [Mycobacteriales bacterium]